MYTDNGLQCVQRVFRGVLLIVDIGLWDNVILFVPAHQIDVLLSIVIHRSLQAQLLVYSLLKGLAEVGHLLDNLKQLLQLQSEEYGRGDGTDRDGRLLFVQHVSLTKILTIA